MTDIIDILKGAKEINSINDALRNISKNKGSDEIYSMREILERKRSIESSIGDTVSLEDVARVVGMFHNIMYLPQGMESLDGKILPAGLIKREHFRLIAGFDIAQIVEPKKLGDYLMSMKDSPIEYVHIPHSKWPDLINGLMEKKGKLPVFKEIKIPYEESSAMFDHKARHLKEDHTKLFETFERAIQLYNGLNSKNIDESSIREYNSLLSKIPESEFSLDQIVDYRNYLVGKFQNNPESLMKEFDFYSTDTQMIMDMTKNSKDHCNYCCLDDSLRSINNRWHGTYNLTKNAFPQINDTSIKGIQE